MTDSDKVHKALEREITFVVQYLITNFVASILYLVRVDVKMMIPCNYGYEYN